MAQLDAAASSQAETAQPELPYAQAVTFAAGQTEGDAPEVPLASATTGQASAFDPSAPPIARGAVPEVEPLWEGSASLGADTGLS